MKIMLTYVLAPVQLLSIVFTNALVTKSSYILAVF